MSIVFLWAVAALGYEVFQLSSQEVVLTLSDTSSITVPATDSQVQTEDYLVSAWVQFDVQHSESVPFIVFGQDKKYSLYRFLFRLSKKSTGHFEADIETGSGERFLADFMGAETRKWEQVTMRVSSSEGEVTCCTSLWQESPQCVSQSVSQQIAVLRTDSSSSVHLANSARPGHHKETVSSGGILNAKLILGHMTQSEVMELMSVYRCADSCTAGCWGPGSSSCSDFVQLLHPDHPRKASIGPVTWNLWDPQYSGHALRSNRSFALTGWLYLDEHSSRRAQVLRVHTRECGLCTEISRDCTAICETLSVHITQKHELQTCLEVSRAPYQMCLDAYLIEEKQWHFLSIAFCPVTQVLELCSGAWGAAKKCVSKDVGGFLEEKLFEVVALEAPGEGGYQMLDLRYYYHTCFTPAKAEEIREEKRKNCRSGCPMLTSLSDVRDERRRLTTTSDVAHYAILSAELSYSSGNNLYFTFENTHVSTVWMYFQVEDLSNMQASYSAYLYKPWNENVDGYQWYLGSGRSFSYKLSPTNQEITRLGGLMTGSYTIRVVGPESGGLFFLEVKIACSSITSACFCPVGTYPNATPSSCSRCAVNDIICNNASSLGCLIVNLFNSTQPHDMFNCYTAGNAQYFNVTSGYRYDCDSTCASCVGSGNDQCASCYPHAELSTNSGPSTCRCSEGFTPVDTSANCLSLSDICASFDGSKCSACYLNAVLIDGNCQCAVGWYPDPYPSKCQPCDSTCATCATIGATECSTCHSNAALVGETIPSSCACNNGYWLDTTSANCSACDVSCFTCLGTGPSQCMSCFDGASLQGAAPNSCECNTEWQPNVSKNKCKVCHSTCLDCSDKTANGCTQCYLNARLSSGYRSACVCKRGFYPNTTVTNCSPCNATCATCTESGETQCLTCYLHAGISRSVPDSCTCNTGWWPNPTSAHCSSCSNTCLACINQDVNGCTRCYQNAELSSGSPSACVCTSGNRPLPDSSQCGKCNSSCATCSHLGPSGCQTCWPNAILQGVAPNSCACITTYYPNTTSANCVSCHGTCLTCHGGSAYNCMSCFPNAFIVSGACACFIGYFPNPSSADCTRCDVTCATCQGTASTNCLTCYRNASLSDGTCKCNDGYFPDSTSVNCTKCNYSCLTCFGRGAYNCLTCYSNASVHSNICVCNSDYYPTPTSANCQTCSSLCKTCRNSGNENCTSCHPNAELLTSSPSSCVCSPSFYPNPTVSTCASCDSSCATCAGGTANECSSCYGFAYLQNTAPSKCVCNAGYYPNTTPANCAICDPSCLTCTDSAMHKCETCHPNAFLRGPAPNFCICEADFYPNPTSGSCSACATEAGNQCSSCHANSTLHGSDPATCVCNLGFYPNPTSDNCSACIAPCTSCTGPLSTQCLVCNPHASLDITNLCVCNPGYWQDLTTGLCGPCDISCLTCRTGTPNGCSECKSNARLEGEGTAACVCITGFYLSNETAWNCMPCSSTCVSCAQSGLDQCTACYPNAELEHKIAPSACLCSLSFYPSPTSASCLPCHPYCSTCVASAINQCSSCKAHAHLASQDIGACVCDTQYFPAPDVVNCNPCSEGCNSCQDAGNCTECAIGFGLFPNNTCGICPLNCANCANPSICKVCKAGFLLTTAGMCKDCINCDVPLTANATGPFGPMYNITFNRLIIRNFTQQDFSLSTNPSSALTWNVVEQHPLQLEVFGGPWKVGTSLLIIFLTQVVDEFGNPLRTQNLTVLAQSGNFASVGTGLKTIVGSAAVLAAMTGSGGLAVTFLSQMQYFSYIGVVNYTLTGDTRSFYLSLDQKSSIPNFFKSSGRVTRNLSSEPSKQGLSSDFLDNAGPIFTVLLVIIGIHMVLIVLDSTLGRRWKLLRKVRKQFEWTIYLYFWYCAYLDLQVACLLECKGFGRKNAEVRVVISLILASATLTLTLLTPLIVLLFIYTKQDLLYTAQLIPYKHHCSALVASFRTDIRCAKYAQVVYYSQRLLYSILIVFASDYEAYSLELLIIPALLMVVFMIVARPMRTITLRVLQIVADIDSLYVFILLCTATLHFDTPHEYICFAIVALTLKSFGCTVLMIVVGTIGRVREYWPRKRDQLIVQPPLQSESPREMVIIKEEEEVESFVVTSTNPPKTLAMPQGTDQRPMRMEDEPE